MNDSKHNQKSLGGKLKNNFVRQTSNVNIANPLQALLDTLQTPPENVLDGKLIDTWQARKG